MTRRAVMKDLKGYLTDEEVNKVLAKCERATVWLLVFLLYRSGRRISELLMLKPEDIQWGKGLIEWHILKKRDPDYKALKPLDSQALQALEEFIQRYDIAPESFVFESPINEGVPYTRDWAYRTIRKLVTNALGQKKIGATFPHPHHFRHSFAINYLKKSNKPAALKMLQQQLDHGNINMTAHYSQFSQDEMREELDRVFVEPEREEDVKESHDKSRQDIGNDTVKSQ